VCVRERERERANATRLSVLFLPSSSGEAAVMNGKKAEPVKKDMKRAEDATARILADRTSFMMEWWRPTRRVCGRMREARERGARTVRGVRPCESGRAHNRSFSRDATTSRQTETIIVHTVPGTYCTLCTTSTVHFECTMPTVMLSLAKDINLPVDSPFLKNG
jgi:hypothetical protein